MMEYFVSTHLISEMYVSYMVVVSGYKHVGIRNESTIQAFTLSYAFRTNAFLCTSKIICLCVLWSLLHTNLLAI